MNIKEIQDSTEPSFDLTVLLDSLHKEGPTNPQILETLSYYKIFHPETFLEFEERFVSALGLFYKIKAPNNVYSFMLSSIGQQHKQEYGEYLTPVQASVRRLIDSNRITSISAPTSAGKSYSVRDFIAEQKGDAVIVVPSRALIAEYINTLKRRFSGDKEVMISAFVDNVFTSRKPRRIFVLTPERARDLFDTSLKLDINVFFFDEAQVSEENERGIIFDVLVRRINKHFPDAKLIFAHPFVDNPDAQLSKHGFQHKDSNSRAYPHASVGKICIYEHSNKKNYYFSPFREQGHLIRNCVELQDKFNDIAFTGEHSVLVYVSKASIYNDSYLNDFARYIKNFITIEDERANEIIITIEHLLGADLPGHDSSMVDLLKKGVVIHHGSIPLDIRFLIEDFIRAGFAKICFATSTLAQGINMPFDIVWLNNMRFLGNSDNGKSLSFKNLIGRSGRLSNEEIFDFGYVFTKSPKLFIQHTNTSFKLKNESIIDLPISDENIDSKELVESIHNESFDDELQIPQSKTERLSAELTLEAARNIIEILYNHNKELKDILHGDANRENRDNIKRYLKRIYETSINRPLLDGEAAVFRQAMSIFIQVIQGRSFREIVGTRYSYISRRDDKKTGHARFSQKANKLPDIKLVNSFSIFETSKRAKDVSYDAIVFDTYDYLDQVISFSLSDTFIAAFKIYKRTTKDKNADKFIELLRYGSNDPVHILLMRYGFPPEDISEIAPYITQISEDHIEFSEDVAGAPKHLLDLVEWYLP